MNYLLVYQPCDEWSNILSSVVGSRPATYMHVDLM